MHTPILFLRRCLVALAVVTATACTNAVQVDGIIWQPDNATARPKENWRDLGVSQLLVQWSVVDDISFIETCGTLPASHPDWQRIAAEPWAQDIILGLAGKYDERLARKNLDSLLAQSKCIAASPMPFKVSAWYFPVEIDPTWENAAELAPLLNQLPRPLWVSVYDNSNIGPAALADWLEKWLPQDVGIFFQDGVGLHMREPHIAVDYAKILQKRFGKARIRIIAEAMRPNGNNGFRPATAEELRAQLAHYRDFTTFLFETRYVPHDVIKALTR